MKEKWRRMGKGERKSNSEKEKRKKEGNGNKRGGKILKEKKEKQNK
jgi:hypothetical protein